MWNFKLREGSFPALDRTKLCKTVTCSYKMQEPDIWVMPPLAHTLTICRGWKREASVSFLTFYNLHKCQALWLKGTKACSKPPFCGSAHYFPRFWIHVEWTYMLSPRKAQVVSWWRSRVSVSDLQFIVSLHCQYLYVVRLYERSSAAPIFVTILAGTHWVTITTVLTSNQQQPATSIMR